MDHWVELFKVGLVNSPHECAVCARTCKEIADLLLDILSLLSNMLVFVFSFDFEIF